MSPGRRASLGLLLAGALLARGEQAVAGGADAGRHLIYLHGRIVQETQSPRPEHPRFGHYELERIADTLRSRGFLVTAGIRPRDLSVSDAADRVVDEVRRLLGSGVPADHVTVVGASMGGAIALVASARLQNAALRFAVLGGCLSESVRRLPAEEGRAPSGRILSIREESDDLTGPCPTWAEGTAPGSPLVGREIVLQTGLSHGFLYRPLEEWVTPVVSWATAE